MSKAVTGHITQERFQDREYELDPKHLVSSFFRVTTHLLTQPKVFFQSMPATRGFRPPVMFLLLCSIVFTIGGSTYIAARRGLFALIFFANSMVMPFFTAFALYIVVGVFFGRRSYETLFRITAYASITQMAAWIPFFSYLTEPWNLFLITVGLAKGCGLTWSRALLAVVITYVVVLLFIWSLQPIMILLRSMLTSL